MAEKRMFAKTIVLSDAFLDMPLSARCLYFTLGMLGDDDGFINNPKSIMRQCGASDDDMRVLLAKKFIIAFESGVIVIKHWRINNLLRSDRYQETKYTEEKNQLQIEKNGAYSVGIPSIGIPSIDKVSIDKVSIDKVIDNPKQNTKQKNETKHKYGEFQNVLLKESEYQKMITELGQEKTDAVIQYFSETKEMKGYVYKSDYLAMKKWGITSYDENKKRTKKSENKNYIVYENPDLKKDFSGECPF